MKSKFYVMCKFISDEPFFFRKLDLQLCTEEFVRYLQKGKKKNPNTIYCETLVVSQTKLTMASPLYVQYITGLLN